MAKSQDECLNLDQILKRVKDLPPEMMIDVYFDPGTLFFHVQFKGVMPFFIPRGATYLFSCQAGKTRLGIEQFISDIICKIERDIKV